MEIALTNPHAAELLKARTALMEVIDPELSINIIDMGLVYEVLFPDAEHIEVRMTLSTPYCPLGEAITGSVQQVLEKTFPQKKILIHLVWDPVWGIDQITEEGKRQLGFK